MENVMQNNEHVGILKQSQSSILLLASLKNFINEEAYSDFEEEQENEEEEQKDILTYSEEREIHRKCPDLIQMLIETVALENFRQNIKDIIQNFKPNA